MKIKFAKDIIKEIENRPPINTDGCVTGEAFEKWLKERRMHMKFLFEHMFEYYTDEEYEKWDKYTDSLIKEYTLCTDTIEIDDHLIELWCYDSDLEQLFDDFGIEVGEALKIEKTFDYDDDYEPVGLDYGDYIETREIHQNGKTYLVPVYCAYNGNGCDYAFAIFEASKKEYSNIKE